MAKTRHALSAKTKNFIVTCAKYTKTRSTHSGPQEKDENRNWQDLSRDWVKFCVDSLSHFTDCIDNGQMQPKLFRCSHTKLQSNGACSGFHSIDC